MRRAFDVWACFLGTCFCAAGMAYLNGTSQYVQASLFIIPASVCIGQLSYINGLNKKIQESEERL